MPQFHIFCSGIPTLKAVKAALATLGKGDGEAFRLYHNGFSSSLPSNVSKIKWKDYMITLKGKTVKVHGNGIKMLNLMLVMEGILDRVIGEPGLTELNPGYVDVGTNQGDELDGFNGEC
ncbi:hypothetical protein PVK06_028304 [Gossypium arboreum]|uniref:Uncharacterized protein n=1 Tax=Gossypium arboreum TaxID=29729 RepID=A0ABR0P4F5_GOSAR|nr:hypothetical protein PVK06_028304 [Gossypium arboreum]